MNRSLNFSYLNCKKKIFNFTYLMMALYNIRQTTFLIITRNKTLIQAYFYKQFVRDLKDNFML
jgi:hypothetical protein